MKSLHLYKSISVPATSYSTILVSCDLCGVVVNIFDSSLASCDWFDAL